MRIENTGIVPPWLRDPYPSVPAIPLVPTSPGDEPDDGDVWILEERDD